MKMDKLFTLCFNIYRFLLFFLFPFFIFGMIMYGIGGHNSNLNYTDYIFLGFILITPIVLTYFKRTKSKKNNRIILKWTSSILVLIGIIIICIGFFNQVLLYKENNFNSGDSFITFLLLLSITLSTIVLVGLMNDKV
jgi:uncharacterized membrane protein YiaA